MIKILTLLAGSLVTLNLNAQIIISQSDFSSFNTSTADTMRQLNVSPKFGVNASWDLSGTSYEQYRYAIKYGTGTSNPNATFWHSEGSGLSSMYYESRVECNISATGIEDFGQSIDRQAIFLSNTGSTSDTLVINAQNITYSSSHKRLALPLTVGTTWQSNFSFSTSMTLKLRAYANGVATPMVRKHYATQTDTVKGWGKVRIRRSDSTVSDWIEVLATSSRIIARDSFFLAGSQPPLSVMATFGIFLGQPDTFYAMEYIRKGEFQPLLHAYFDAGYSSVNIAYVHINRIPGSSLGIIPLPATESFKLYPNPATTTGGFDIELTETAPGTWSYNLLDASGKVVSSATLVPSGSKAHINAAQTAPGTYFLNLQNNGQQVATKPVLIK